MIPLRKTPSAVKDLIEKKRDALSNGIGRKVGLGWAATLLIRDLKAENEALKSEIEILKSHKQTYPGKKI